ncbi:DNA adenine methylase [Thiothrix nivea]|uniref:site-specific DNA-methyltransferase (adenine-specific) n=1 Tax=Thiothrix nivea (strain ATCC 35100 / DSM 5205 / JP2) TaxID=870187 RepID=A0A656HAN1_THINJ|nr:DNA adenine methylase [Thiothrix nivea]EIJ33357.1 D12 class N6 adenine-specific DNA methyltransferase [Thiothrix nivea DSM 5205]
MMHSPVRSPLAGWFGGKYQLSRHIISRIPSHDCYAEPFAGAAWVLFRKEPSKAEIINDINREIVTLYRCVQNHLEEFCRHFRYQLTARDESRRKLDENPETMTDIQRAARFFYIHQNAFAGRIGRSPSFGTATEREPKLNLLRVEETLSAAHLRLANVYIENLPYTGLISRYDRPRTFFYIDPPYWDCEDDYGKNIFSKEDFGKLADQLHQVKGKFLLSLNDTDGVRKAFTGFNMEEVTVTYSSSRTSRPKARELFITNY